jgi:AcrR family transcriptional regulator
MRLFVERGFDEVTIAEVAEAADVSVNTVFNHFPTKEDLFFGSGETAEARLARMVDDRRPGEPVIAFLRRQLFEGIERFGEAPRGPGDHESWASIREVFRSSPALQVRAAHRARGSARDAEDSLTAALARDAGQGPDDPIPRLVAGQVLALYATLFLEAEGRRRAGQAPEAILAYLRSAAEAALGLLEHGLGDYGAGTDVRGDGGTSPGLAQGT